MKFLFITHAASNLNYGAAKSLGFLLNNIEYHFDIIFPFTARIRCNLNKVLRTYAGKKCDKIWHTFLLFNYGAVYGQAVPKDIYTKFERVILKILSGPATIILKKHINSGEYDYVHLNSLALCMLIDENNNYIIHVREIFRGSPDEFKNVCNKLRLAKKIIFIDDATYEPFKGVVENSIILNNPFDMTCLKDISSEAVSEKYCIPSGKVIFSILGVIIEMKGVEFVISAFHKSKRQDICLLIVGRIGSAHYFQKCLDASNSDPRILFIGNTTEPEEIYKISDYIIRGDDCFCIGRTIYEGLYSGCDVILPICNSIDCNRLFEIDAYRTRVSSYMVRNIESLKSIIDNCGKIDKNLRDLGSNVREYVAEFNNFIEK